MLKIMNKIEIPIGANYQIMKKLVNDYDMISALLEKMESVKPTATTIERLKVIKNNYHNILDNDMIKLQKAMIEFFDSLNEDVDYIVEHMKLARPKNPECGLLLILNEDINEYTRCINKIYSILNDCESRIPLDNCGFDIICAVLDCIKLIPRPMTIDKDDDYYITRETLHLIDETINSAHLTLIKYLENGCAYISVYKETDQDFIYNGEAD